MVLFLLASLPTPKAAKSFSDEGRMRVMRCWGKVTRQTGSGGDEGGDDESGVGVALFAGVGEGVGPFEVVEAWPFVVVVGGELGAMEIAEGLNEPEAVNLVGPFGDHVIG